MPLRTIKGSPRRHPITIGKIEVDLEKCTRIKFRKITYENKYHPLYIPDQAEEILDP
jgi:hypothetical protein